MAPMSESQIQRTILDLLAAKHVFALRMQVGAISAEHNGKKRFMRFGEPGQADILAFPKVMVRDLTRGGLGQAYPEARIVWIEVKAEKGKQSELQKSFQQKVESEGHRYILARSVDDVLEVLNAK